LRPLQVVLKLRQWAEFVVVDEDALEKLTLVHSRIPGAGPLPAGPHGLVAALLRHCVALCAPDSRISKKFRDEMIRHVAYHRPIIGMHSWTELDDAADGFRVKKPREEAADGVRQCVAELLAHLATGVDVKLDLVGTP